MEAQLEAWRGVRLRLGASGVKYVSNQEADLNTRNRSEKTVAMSIFMKVIELLDALQSIHYPCIIQPEVGCPKEN